MVKKIIVPQDESGYIFDNREQEPTVAKLLTEYLSKKNINKKNSLEKKNVAYSNFLVFGISHVTQSIKKKRAKLVLFAANIEPAEVAVSLPALCRFLKIPYVIMTSTKKLGKILKKKNLMCMAVQEIEKDEEDLINLCNTLKENYNNRNKNEEKLTSKI